MERTKTLRKGFRPAVHRLAKVLCGVCIGLLAVLPLKAQLNTDGIIIIGRNALYYEDYALAIQYFNQVIDAKPYLYEPYYYRAVAKYYLGDYVGAAADCSLSIERDPFIDNCFRLRAISEVMNGDMDKASADYQLLIKRNRDDKDSWYNLVLCQTQMKRFAAADSLLDSMIVRWPRYSRCYMLKAQIALENKDTIQADTLIRRTLAINPYDVDALAAQGMLYMQHADFANAEATYDKAIIQSPKQSGFYLNRALARYRRNNLRGAMDDYDIALDIDPDNYQGHYNRGLLRMQVGENNLAIEDFNFVLLKEPHDRLALFNRATLLEKTGNYRAAADDYTTVLQDYPNFLAGYESRARCRRRYGDAKGALADERKVYIARLDDMFGQQKRRSPRKTRKEKEQDIDDYQKMVVDNDEDNIAKFYASDYRGRIQNKDVAVEQQPVYMLTFNRAASGLSKTTVFEPFVEKLNAEKLFSRPLYLSPREGAATAEDIRELDSEALRTQQRLVSEKRNSHLLFACAFYSSCKRDYTSALSDLDQALSLDSNFVAALFLRSVVKTKQAEARQFKQSDVKSATDDASARSLLYMPAVADLDRAIRLNPTCAYFYYNRGCAYARMNDVKHALDDFDQAVKLNTSLAEAYYNRGLLRVETADYSQGFADLSKAGELGLYSAYSLIKHFRKIQGGTK